MRMLPLLALGAALAWSGVSYAYQKSRPVYTLSLQYIATTPNAGGQQAYALRLAHNDDWELGAFSNHHLLAGKHPLSGATVSKRFAICAHPCLLRSFVQLGVGASTAGPMAELLWGFNPLWLLRIDIVTHIYMASMRPIIWSYPLWLGLSLPF